MGMNVEIGPGRSGDPALYIDNHPVAEVFDVERMQKLLSKLEQYESFFGRIQGYIETNPSDEIGYHLTHLQLNNMLVEFLNSINDEKD
jgi:hypothetical protein